jgi:hypothetical protein
MDGNIFRKAWGWFKEDAKAGVKILSAEGRYTGGFPTAHSREEVEASLKELLAGAQEKIGQTATQAAMQDEIKPRSEQEE